ncbi:MAG: PAP/fibrillin family protein [Cyanobacteriota bacterium]
MIENSPSPSPSTSRERLLAQLRLNPPSGQDLLPLITALEQEQPADLDRDGALLEGVWELRWSSSRLPYLSQAPWLENLQVLAPSQGRAMNLLRLAGLPQELGGVAVQARIALEGRQRVSVRFERGGWWGPRWGGGRLQWLAQLRQGFPAWLDITVLDPQLRVCRGNAGTVFALLRRDDLAVESFLPPARLPEI